MDSCHIGTIHFNVSSIDFNAAQICHPNEMANVILVRAADYQTRRGETERRLNLTEQSAESYPRRDVGYKMIVEH